MLFVCQLLHKPWLPISPAVLLFVVHLLLIILCSSYLLFSPHFIHEVERRPRKVMNLFEIACLGSNRARLLIRKVGRKYSLPCVPLHTVLLALKVAAVYYDSIVCLEWLPM